MFLASALTVSRILKERIRNVERVPKMTVSHQELAQRLRDAYTGGAVPPLRDGLEPLDITGAYAVQTINTRFWEEQGRRIVGRKAGLTAKVVQQQKTGLVAFLCTRVPPNLK